MIKLVGDNDRWLDRLYKIEGMDETLLDELEVLEREYWRSTEDLMRRVFEELDKSEAVGEDCFVWNRMKRIAKRGKFRSIHKATSTALKGYERELTDKIHTFIDGAAKVQTVYEEAFRSKLNG